MERTKFLFLNNFSDPFFLCFLWSILIHIICHKHNAKTNLLFLLKSSGICQQIQMVWKSDLCCVRRANQINSSNWLMATSFWPRLSVDYSISVVAKCIFIFSSFFEASCQSQPLSLSPLSPTTQLSIVFFFFSLSTFCRFPHRTQVNYIRFINLASSVSRREKERKAAAR